MNNNENANPNNKISTEFNEIKELLGVFDDGDVKTMIRKITHSRDILS